MFEKKEIDVIKDLKYKDKTETFNKSFSDIMFLLGRIDSTLDRIANKLDETKTGPETPQKND